MKRSRQSPAPKPAATGGTKPTSKSTTARSARVGAAAQGPAPKASGAAAEAPAPAAKAAPPTPKAAAPKGGSAAKPTALRRPRPSPAPAPGGKPANEPSLPPILFEGDLPPLPSVSGPGRRYALGPVAPTHGAELAEESGELPEAYGTRRLFVTARDPHWLYAHWDFTRNQLRECNLASADRHLVLRVYTERAEGAPCSEVHVHPESRNWFVHVGQGGRRYLAELGYYRQPDRRWFQVALSDSTLTPPDSLSPDAPVEFATIPIDTPFETLIALVRTAAIENVPLAEAIMQLRAGGFANLPEPATWTATRWTPAQLRQLSETLAAVISMDSVRRIWVGSLEITELVRRQLAQQLGSAAVAAFGQPAPAPAGLGSISSPFGGEEQRRKFWFMVNAELIIYGATEPDASVTLGGRPIRLRPDGTFSFRFALPDGQFELPAEAVSAAGDDRRRAALTFTRATGFAGEVGRHPQDPALKPPLPDHVG